MKKDRPALTEKQLEIHEYIKLFIKQEGIPPTRKEIAEALGYKHVTSVVGHLAALEKKGYWEVIPGKSRGLRVIK